MIAVDARFDDRVIGNTDDFAATRRKIVHLDVDPASIGKYALAQDGIWSAERWREALQAWNEGRLLRRSWRYLAPSLRRMPDEKLNAIAQSVTWWLEASGKVFDEHETVFLELCRRFLGKRCFLHTKEEA